MMNFRLIAASIAKILQDSSGNCFRVTTEQTLGKAAEQMLGNNRLVEVYHRTGQPQLESSAYSGGPIQELNSYQIELSVAGDAKLDLETLKRVDAQSYEKAGVLATPQFASVVANESFDELMELVMQILLDPRNIDMGMPEGIVGKRWISDRRKDDPQLQGDLVVLTGVLVLSLLVEEQITGAPILGTGDIHNITLDGVDDDIERTGVEVNS